MSQVTIHQVLAQKYQYDKGNPQFVSVDGKYKIFKGSQKDVSLNVSIKILLGSSDPALGNYLSRLKSLKSDQVIKIYEILVETNYLVVVTEQVVYGTVFNGLMSCKKFDENDAIFVCKYLLAGYMDIARAGTQWYGTTNDIEITQNGLKLSWNNTMPISASSSNTFRQVLEQISTYKIPQNEQRLLPFPESKQLKQLYRLSETTPSQISLAPLMKKKQKYLKKKFKSYLLIKETKVPGQYFEETIYLAVNKQSGFVKIKSYKKGTLNPNIAQLNKTKNTFTKILQIHQEANLVYIVSAYSNDGTLQSYVQKLKANGIQLREDQIQFFFFSLFQPIKAIQESSIKSLNTTLHIKNVYIENGIPKIGEPIPLNEEVKEKLKQRADVPDFYHKKFKQNPNISDPSYDTYSLGVLLYKLMYTEYPIFPQGAVHIPTAPTFSSRLKKSLQIFLNEGGRLAEIQKRIEVSQKVLKQVKRNKQALLKAKRIEQNKKKNQRKKNHHNIFIQDQDIAQENTQKADNQTVQKQKMTDQQYDEGQGLQDDCFQCFTKLQIADHTIDLTVESLEQSPYKIYRLCTKFFCFLLLYILLMYMFYLRDNVMMLSSMGNLAQVNVTISTVNYKVITSDVGQFYLLFNQTGRMYGDLVSMGCLINSNNSNTTNYYDYSQIVSSTSPKWLVYLISGLVFFFFIIIIKSALIFKFDYIKAKYNYQHGVANFNYSNYIIINLLLCSVINQHFEFFSLVFYTTLPACLGMDGGELYASVQLMLNQQSEFLYMHLPTICGIAIATVAHFIMIYRTQKIKYTKLLNPIFIFSPFLIAYFLIVRVGVIKAFFYPTAINDSEKIIRSYFTSGDYIGILGIVPEILFLIQIVIYKLIDLFYWMIIDKKRRVMIHESSTENIQLYQYQ